MVQLRQVGDDLVKEEGDGPSSTLRVLPECGYQSQTEKYFFLETMNGDFQLGLKLAGTPKCTGKQPPTRFF